MKIYAIRHGLSLANLQGVIQGHSDTGLADSGIAQAKLLGKYFNREGIHPDVIYTSPLQRAFNTASLIAENLDNKPDVVPQNGLMEINVGKLSGVSMEEALKRYPGGWSGDVNKWLDFSLAGGESFYGFFDRVSTAVNELIENWDLLEARTVFFVAHAGTLRPILKTLLATESDMMFFTFGNCCHIKLEYRLVSNGIRRVMSDLVTIDTVAALMGEKLPSENTKDTVGEKIG
jgi:broad specificity phosphatase PhoE